MYDSSKLLSNQKKGQAMMTMRPIKIIKCNEKQVKFIIFYIFLSIPGKFYIESQEGKFHPFCKSCPPLQQHQGHKQSNTREQEAHTLDFVTLNPTKVSPWWIPAHY